MRWPKKMTAVEQLQMRNLIADKEFLTTRCWVEGKWNDFFVEEHAEINQRIAELLEDCKPPAPVKKVVKFVPPTLNEVAAYARERNQGEDMAVQFHEYFTEGQWVDAKGQKVVKWKQKFLTWIKFNGINQQNNRKRNDRNEGTYNDGADAFATS